MARYRIASTSTSFADAISPELQRTSADTLVAEVLPLLAACKFLEQEATRVLETRKLGRRGLPFWLFGLANEVQRVPFGKILIIGPSNYPLLLPGVQAMQALVAGNSVIWKPGHGGKAVADLMAQVLYDVGLPKEAIRVTDESVEAANREIDAGVDKVFFTGSSGSGHQLLSRLASSIIPSVAELSGCDGVIVLPSADLERVVKALLFGMRLNGSATCMAPRRVLLVDAALDRRTTFLEMLKRGMQSVGKVALSHKVWTKLSALLDDARQRGAVVIGDVRNETCQGRSESFPRRRSKREPLRELESRRLWERLMFLGMAGAEPVRRPWGAARFGRRVSLLQKQASAEGDYCGPGSFFLRLFLRRKLSPFISKMWT